MIDFSTWRQDEFGYCAMLIATRGDKNVGRDPKTIATYLRLQGCAAYHDAIRCADPARSSYMEISARLHTAASMVSEDARNNHAPRWIEAEEMLGVNL